MSSEDDHDLRRPVVFGGPSFSRLTANDRSRLDLRPPARRGDIDGLLHERRQRRHRPGRAVLVDGLFGAQLAVSPHECRRLIDEGWQLFGASSIGALRASELWNVGMIGVGQIYTWMRAGTISSDAEVAVAYDPDTHREMTVSLVHARAVLAELEQQGLSSEDGDQLFAAAAEIYWGERSVRRLVHEAWSGRVEARWLALAEHAFADEQLHPKRIDGALAVRAALSTRW